MSSSCADVGKNEWPELRGRPGEMAVAMIEMENPSVTVHLVLEGSQVPENVRCDRVLVWVNDIHIVTRVPFIG